MKKGKPRQPCGDNTMDKTSRYDKGERKRPGRRKVGETANASDGRSLSETAAAKLTAEEPLRQTKRSRQSMEDTIRVALMGHESMQGIGRTG